MPWVEALLRGQKVYARANADGSLASEGGRVEIRYKPNDGRAYRAAAANLSPAPGARVLPDETCVAGEPVARDSAPGKPARASSGGAKSGANAVQAKAQWIAYTDGACSGNPGPCGAGAVVIAPGGKILEGYAFLGDATNNVGELAGVLIALEAIPSDAESIAIHTDSKYAIGVLTMGWKAKKNPELIAKTRALIAKRSNVRLVYVPGHSGVPMNERADELAREAIRARRSQPIVVPTG